MGTALPVLLSLTDIIYAFSNAIIQSSILLEILCTGHWDFYVQKEEDDLVVISQSSLI